MTPADNSRPAAPVDPEHEALVLAHRGRREARYRSPDSWLTLVERIPLEPGENPVPLGALVVDPAGQVALEVAPGAQVTRAGQVVSGRVAVAVDEPGSQPDRFEYGGRRYDVARRGEHLSLRVRDPDAPARVNFPGIPFYPIDPAWRIHARLEPIDPPRVDHVGTTDGGEGEGLCIGVAHFTAAERQLTLSVYRETHQRLFVPFADATSGAETYGGGRMLYTAPPAGPDQPLVLDFNLAFNPPCAFNSLVSCPLPPRQNRLPVAIRAGEKQPAA